MAVYTRVNSKDINYIEKNYNIGKIKSFNGIICIISSIWWSVIFLNSKRYWINRY